MKLKTTISLILLTLFCGVSVFPQEREKFDFSKLLLNGKFSQDIKLRKEQCKKFATKDFEGERISVNVVNAELSDVLEYITDYHGLNFVVDRSVKAKAVTVNVTNVPWNLILVAILDAQDLDIQIHCPYLRIANNETLIEEEEVKTIISCPAGEPPKPITKVIKLKNIPLCINKVEPKKRSLLFRNLDKIISRRLTKKGEVEIDKSNYLIAITDFSENVVALKKLIFYLDVESSCNNIGKYK